MSETEPNIKNKQMIFESQFVTRLVIFLNNV